MARSLSPVWVRNKKHTVDRTRPTVSLLTVSVQTAEHYRSQKERDRALRLRRQNEQQLMRKMKALEAIVAKAVRKPTTTTAATTTTVTATKAPVTADHIGLSNMTHPKH
ncbi:hypothetical protein BX616_003375 [Lobosporangium transversale]|nr:hypothetical protein BX616_003375 [Lobosporangium transversale]